MVCFIKKLHQVTDIPVLIVARMQAAQGTTADVGVGTDPSLRTLKHLLLEHACGENAQTVHHQVRKVYH